MKSLKKLAKHKKVKPAMKKCNENCHYPRVQSAVWKPVKPVVKDGVKMQISFAVKHISDAFSSDFTKYVKEMVEYIFYLQCTKFYELNCISV